MFCEVLSDNLDAVSGEEAAGPRTSPDHAEAPQGSLPVLREVHPHRDTRHSRHGPSLPLGDFRWSRFPPPPLQLQPRVRGRATGRLVGRAPVLQVLETRVRAQNLLLLASATLTSASAAMEALEPSRLLHRIIVGYVGESNFFLLFWLSVLVSIIRR